MLAKFTQVLAVLVVQEIAKAIYHDLDKHLGLKDGHLLQMQGKVLDQERI